MKIRVLVVDDSAVMRDLIVSILDADSQIEVIGTAENGKQAIEAVQSNKPDVITIDYHMPEMNGLDASRKIMEQYPTPIIIMSGTAVADEAAMAFHLIDVGAVAIVGKPVGTNHPDYENLAKDLVQTVKSMAQVKVVRRWPRRESESLPRHISIATRLDSMPHNIEIVAIGASTGGPVVIKTILSQLPKNFPVPILIVQHIAQGFTQGFVDWLTKSTGFAVQMAISGTRPLPQRAYVAPDGFHMVLTQNGRIELNKNEPINGHRPSVSALFRSVAITSGSNAIGVLLTGMGKDGAVELKLMKDHGAITIVQDEESSIVFGMPGEAMKLDAASFCLASEAIATQLISLVQGIYQDDN